MSITGHKSIAEVERYTREASQKKLATAAILKLEQNTNRTDGGKRPPVASGKQIPVVDSQMVTDPAPLTFCYPEVEALGSVRSSTSIGGST
jgi:hypothetical protein